MIFRFGRKQVSDVVRVVNYLEKENIDYQLLVDHLDVQVGGVAPALPSAEKLVPPPDHPGPPINPMAGIWKAAEHDGIICKDEGCLDVAHLGGVPV